MAIGFVLKVATSNDRRQSEEEGSSEMTWKEILEGEEMTINAAASDIEFVQKLIALNEQITDEINLQANGLLLDEGARGGADSFNHLKALVGEMHTLLSNTVCNEAPRLARRRRRRRKGRLNDRRQHKTDARSGYLRRSATVVNRPGEVD